MSNIPSESGAPLKEDLRPPQIPSNAIPGMTEPIEQALLTRLAESADFSGGRQAVEFGAFFGRSTACIANGMANNGSLSASSKLHVFDSFSCHRRDGFIKHVVAFAKSGGVEKLLRAEGHMVSFLPVFSHYLQSHIERGLVTPHIEQLRDSAPPGGPICLMHIDSPKFYEEFKTVLFRFFPRCEAGTTIVFQDYFYHWSASLIAAVELLRQTKVLEPGETAASSLSAKMLRVPTRQDLMEVDLEMQSEARVTKLLTDAAENASNLSTDRADIFGPRVRLALIQHLFAAGKHTQVAEHFRQLIMQKQPLKSQVLSDYLELLSQGFSIRAVYERDHA